VGAQLAQADHPQREVTVAAARGERLDLGGDLRRAEPHALAAVADLLGQHPGLELVGEDDPVRALAQPLRV
jgi:hypothetical protein